MMCPDLARIDGFRPHKAWAWEGIFLGSLTRVSVLLSGDVTVQVDVPSTESAALAPGTSVDVSVAEAEVLVTARR